MWKHLADTYKLVNEEKPFIGEYYMPLEVIANDETGEIKLYIARVVGKIEIDKKLEELNRT